MRVERNFRAFLGLAILLGGFLAAFLVARRLQLRSSTSDPSPLTATIIEERYSPGSTQPSYVEYSLSAVRSDGSWAVISRRQAPDGRWVEMKLVTSLASGTRITVDPTTESLVTFKLSKGAASFFQSQRVACGKVPNPQRSTLLGYDVVELTEPFGPPEGTDTVTRWLAPSLGCFPLKEVYDIAAEGGGRWKTVRQALFVIPGEPSADLFNIPGNYTERSPSELNAEFKRRYPGQHAFPDVTAQRLESLYETNRSEH